MNEELLQLVRDNPDLPVVPMVHAEIVSADWGWYLASIGDASIDEFVVTKKDGTVYFKSDDDVFDVLENALSDEEFNALPENETECRPVYESLPWKKAIIVWIHPYKD